MTVCIAAIAEEAQAIVLLADRAISMVRGGQTVLKADSGLRKIRELQNGWAGLISGPIDFGERVLSLATHDFVAWQKRGKELGGEAPQMAECVKNAFQSCRKEAVIDHILMPRLVDENWYLRRLAEQPSREDVFFTEISRHVRDFSTESTMLVCGFEKETPEIYVVTDPGVLHSESAAGFGVAGIGEDAARSRIFTLETNPGDSLPKVMYDAYDAKESCHQLLPDVGHEWDGLILTEGRPPVQVPHDIRVIIEALHKGHSRSPFDKSSVRPRDWHNRLQSFAKIVMNKDLPPSAVLAITQRRKF